MIKKKKCGKCKEFKPFNKFHKYKKGKYKRQNWCKSCRLEYQQSPQGKKTIKAYRIKWNESRPIEYKEKLKAYKKAYRQSTKGKEAHRLSNIKYEKANPLKAKAHKTVAYLIKSGKLIKPQVCPVCDDTDCKIIAHHKDYTQPANVVFLCNGCHSAEHKRLKNEVANVRSFNSQAPYFQAELF